MGLGVSASRFQRVLLLKNCLAIICRDRRKLSQQAKSKDAHVDGWTLFKSFVRENSQCFWNQCLVQCVQSLEYRGYIVPTTILVSGGEYSLDVVRSAWARRGLRPPVGYDILRLGEWFSNRSFSERSLSTFCIAGILIVDATLDIRIDSNEVDGFLFSMEYKRASKGFSIHEDNTQKNDEVCEERKSWEIWTFSLSRIFSIALSQSKSFMK